MQVGRGFSVLGRPVPSYRILGGPRVRVDPPFAGAGQLGIRARLPLAGKMAY